MVHPLKQGQGIGTKLLLEIEKQYQNQRYELFTSTRSEKNIALYQKLGYKIFDEKQVTEELRFVCGIVLGLLYIRTNSVFCCTIAHGGYNLISYVVMIYPKIR